MTKQKILLLVPFGIIAGFLIYSWIIILSTEVVATWRHYLAAVLFFVLIFSILKNFKWTILATIIYLILGTCNLLTLTPSVTTNSYGAKIGSIEMWTPSFQILSFGLLVLFLILNFDTLINMYLDYKETKEQNKK